MSLEICQAVRGLSFPVCTESNFTGDSLEIVSRTSSVGLVTIANVAVGLIQLLSFGKTCYSLDKGANCSFTISWLFGAASAILLLVNTLR